MSVNPPHQSLLRLRCPASACVDGAPWHLPTAAHSEPSLDSATGGAQARGPLQGEEGVTEGDGRGMRAETCILRICFRLAEMLRFRRSSSVFLLRKNPPSVCGTRCAPCRERLRCTPTAAHSAPSLYLPLAALRLEPPPGEGMAGDRWSPLHLDRRGATPQLCIVHYQLSIHLSP